LEAESRCGGRQGDYFPPMGCKQRPVLGMDGVGTVLPAGGLNVPPDIPALIAAKHQAVS